MVDENQERFAKVVVDGQKFRLCSTVVDLCELVRIEGRGVLRFRSLDYRATLIELKTTARDLLDSGLIDLRDLFASPLLCAGCLWQFPGSYRLSLQSQGVLGNLIGATAGFDNFGQTGVCPQCGSSLSIFVFESFPPDSITDKDLRAIRRYWHSQARNWWGAYGTTKTTACARCSASIPRNEGYLAGTQMLCDECINNDLMSVGLEQLRKDPHYYGAGLIRKARASR
jgi:hypothetical protein